MGIMGIRGIAQLTAEDRARSLRRAADRLQVALLALETWDLRRAGAPESAQQQSERRLLVDVAAQLLWEYVVQREAGGLRDHRELLRQYRVPREVWQRIGATPRPA